MDILIGWGGQLFHGTLVTLQVAFAALALGLVWASSARSPSSLRAGRSVSSASFSRW